MKYYINYITYLQLARLKDKLEENVLRILIVIEHVILLDLLPVLLFVLLMDVSVPLEQS